MKYDDIDAIYQKLTLEKIPWNSEIPPKPLVDLIRNGTIPPCRAIDLGCGAGNYAIFLAESGFFVTGVDISPTAVSIARNNAQKRGVSCTFIVADLLGDLHEINGKFDFAYDWELLHHIFPEDRDTYINNIYTILNSRAFYFSVCFSEQDPQFGGNGKTRHTQLGTTLYFSSESELRDLVAPYFDVLSLQTIEISGKFGPHMVIALLAKRR